MNYCYECSRVCDMETNKTDTSPIHFQDDQAKGSVFNMLKSTILEQLPKHVTVKPLIQDAPKPKTCSLAVVFPNPSKPCVKSKMKVLLEQSRQAMLQLHMSNQQFYGLLRRNLYQRLGGCSDYQHGCSNNGVSGNDAWICKNDFNTFN